MDGSDFRIEWKNKRSFFLILFETLFLFVSIKVFCVRRVPRVESSVERRSLVLARKGIVFTATAPCFKDESLARIGVCCCVYAYWPIVTDKSDFSFPLPIRSYTLYVFILEVIEDRRTRKRYRKRFRLRPSIRTYGRE